MKNLSVRRHPAFAVLLLAGTLLAVAAGTAGAQQEQQLTIVSFGGAFQDAQMKAKWAPAAKALGITLKQETYTGIADLRLKAKAGAVTWDIVGSGSGGVARAGSEGLLEPIDYKTVEASVFGPGMSSEYCVGGDVFSNVFAFNTKTYPDGGPQPRTWADFWDVKKFPGKRSYRNAVAGSLEPALMADGVPPEKVYEVLSAPGGIERALKKIKELKPYISVWWSSGAQHAQLMKDGEVDMVTGWNGRFDDVIKDGGKVRYGFDQAIIDVDCYAVPKGAPNKALAMKFLNEISKPQYQAELVKYINYGPTNRKTFEGNALDPAIARRLPSYPENTARQMVLDPAWYLKNEERATQMYQNMLSE
jgi:putative spermidine/putrescine transport system substrate-binding protein